MPEPEDSAAVRRIAEIIPKVRTTAEFLAEIRTEEIETALAGFPDVLSDSLTLITLAITRIEKLGGFVSNAEMSERIDHCATHLSLEWLQRNEAITYDFPADGEVIWKATARCTPEFTASLKGRHETLYRFTLALLASARSARN